MNTLWQDIKYGARMLVKKPSFTIVVALTLGLGIGANTAIFSIVNAFLFRPLPVPDAHQLTILASQEGQDADLFNMSYLDYLDYRDQADAFEDITVYTMDFLGLATREGADRILVSYVDGNFFSLLGLKPAAGRLIQPDDGDPQNPTPVVVLGHSYWKRRFNSDPSIIGEGVTINGRAFTVVGVAPEHFRGAYFVADVSVYLPLGMSNEVGGYTPWRDDRGRHTLRGIGRMKEGVTLAQAQASLDVVARRLQQAHPETNKDIRARAIPENLARPEPDASNNLPLVATIFLLLVGLVLLVACVNVANILLVRATVRQKELAIRAAMGASRTRLLRQLLTESVLLAIIGGLVGVAMGLWASDLLGSIRMPGDIPIVFDFGFDWRVFGYALTIALLTGIVAGILPGLRATKTDINDTLREGGRMLSGGAGRHRVRSALVVAQVAGSLVVLVAAGLFIRSLDEIQRMDLGFNPRNLLNLSMDLSMQGYDEDRQGVFYRDLLRRVRSLPGVQSASLAFTYPAAYYSTGTAVWVEGQLPPSGEPPPRAGRNTVSTDYFTTMEIPILEGRAFTSGDIIEERPVLVINQSLAKRHWPEESAIGKRISLSGREGPYRDIVGVVANSKYQNISSTPSAYAFVPFLPRENALGVLQVRTPAAPASLAPAVRQEIRALDPSLPVFDVMTMEETLQGGNGFFLYRMGAVMASVMGLLGLALAAVGIYGVVSFSASQRTHEIGIRMALGAKPASIFRLVVGQGMILTLIGIGLGLLLAGVAAQGLASLLYGVSALDPVTFVLSLAVILAAAFIAALGPARRATRVDPMVALRYE